MTLKDRVALAAKGEYPYVIRRLASGWLCLAETQPIEGYCVLFSDPVVEGLHNLSIERRAQWGVDCGTAGDALIEVLGALRVNYETWGNVDLSLHTHITPRFSTEPMDKRPLTPREAYSWNAAPKTDLALLSVQTLIKNLRANLADI
jgi:diadenosine tetraphosphate (Ap4A) HIT family hydrolase